MARLFSPAIARCTGPMWALGSDGWTTFYPSADSRRIYVANSGSNANDGLSPGSPVQTLKYAQSLTRNNFPDQILLNRGDTFINGWVADQSDGFGGTTANGNINRSGRSRNEPFVVGNYGSTSLARPKVIPLSTRVREDFFASVQNACNNFVIQGVEFYSPGADPDNAGFSHWRFVGTVTAGSNTITNIVSTADLFVGMSLCGPGVNSRTIVSIDSTVPGSGQITMNNASNYNATGVEIDAYLNLCGGVSFNGWAGFLYIEDCFFNHTGLAHANDTPRRDFEFIFRRNIIANSYVPLSRSQGLFMSDYPVGTQTVQIKENFFYSNGINRRVWGADSATSQSHNAYCHDDHPLHEYERNISAFAAGHSYMQRNGSKRFNNLDLECGQNGTWGSGLHPNPLEASYNVFLNSTDRDQPYLTAVSATSVGTTPATITFSGIPSDSNGTSPHIGYLTNIDNPGSFISTRQATTITGGKVMNLNGAIAAGARGDGVQPGDRICVTTALALGFDFGPSTASYLICPGNVTGVTYPIGSTGPFYLGSDCPLPTRVEVGDVVIIDNNQGGNPQIKFPANTKVASIAGNRLSFTTDTASVGAILGADPNYSRAAKSTAQATVVFYDPINESVADFPTSRFGPNNIVCHSLGRFGGDYGVRLKASACYVDATGNYFYKWNTNTALNVQDLGHANIISPQALNSNTTVAAYEEATIEGYMTSLGLTPTKAAFYAGCFANRRGAWDLRFTAPAVNTFIRGKFGAPEPS